MVRIRGVDVALAICEDLWQDGGPVSEYALRGPGFLLVPNGSPYERNKHDVRLELCRRRARGGRLHARLLNTVGGQDELVFDGDSLGRRRGGRSPRSGAAVRRGAARRGPRCPAVRPQLDRRSGRLDGPGAGVRTGASADSPRLEDPADVYAALVLGLRDYARKNAFTSVVFGLSGGIDSALVASIACDALGADAVHAVSMPSQYSSDHSLADAAELAQRTGLHRRVIPIEPMVSTFVET